MGTISFADQPITQIIEQKELILQELKKSGCKITKQRTMIIDVILENECSSCKEIYYQAFRKDSTIGIATVYRMLKTLEELGAINRKNPYKISRVEGYEPSEGFIILFKDKESIHLSSTVWEEVLKAGLKAKGFIKDDDIDSIVIKSCYA